MLVSHAKLSSHPLTLFPRLNRHRYTCNSEDYATIDNAVVTDNIFEDASCTSSPLPVPPGWRLADWDADIAFVSLQQRRRDEVL